MATARRTRRERSQRRTGVLVGIAAAVLSGLLVYQVFMRSDSTGSVSTANAPVGAASSSPTTTVPQEPTLPNGSFDELSLRDPFEDPSGGGGGTTPTSSTSSTTTTTTPGSIPTTPTTTPEQNPSPTTDVALEDVFETNGVKSARIRVGGTSYTVSEGQVFAVNYQLVSFTNATCVQLRYADSPFSLCEGEQVFK